MDGFFFPAKVQVSNMVNSKKNICNIIFKFFIYPFSYEWERIYAVNLPKYSAVYNGKH